MFSFTKRRKQTEVREYLQRLLNRTTPVVAQPDERAEDRYSRSIAVIVVPWTDGPVLRESTFALVHNLSDRGAGIVTDQNRQVDQVLCGFWVDGLQFVLAKVRSKTPVGGGYWLVGVEFSELVTLAECPDLEPLCILAAGLMPPQEVTTSALAG
jgi:hypothetical protein